MNFEILSKNRKRIKREDRMRVPVLLNVSDAIMPCQKTLKQLAEIACHDSVYSHIAALADIHYKSRNECPTGVAIATEDKIVPQFLDSGLNCGMRMMKTSLFEDSLNERFIDSLFYELQKNIPIKAKNNNRLNLKEFLNICKWGSPYIIKKYNLDPEEEQFIEHGGNIFKGEDINDQKLQECIPNIFMNLSQNRFGILGEGNHFIELQKIDEIIDEALAKLFGIQKGQVVILMHTGSSALGSLISHFYGSRKMNAVWSFSMFFARLFFLNGRRKEGGLGYEIKRLIKLLNDKQEIYAMDDSSDEGKLFLRAMNAAHNFGYASRTFIMNKIRQSFSDSLSSKDFKLSLLYDMSHVSIYREDHYGKKMWVHRHGASRAFPPALMNGHPVFSKTGEPVFIPGSMGDPTYLGVGHPENSDCYFSSSHGAGVTSGSSKLIVNNMKELIEKMNKRKIKLFKDGNKFIKKIDPDQFKDINDVVDGMVENKIIRPVAKMIPCAVMKG
ncbi:MAG: hypothetical protein CMQ15_18120 [Gammaproteobacteria bacterium]|jgi:tRNA-splicing ligase RtcB|nr:hypothetical protein [Gammaproteobacteria bacterium]|tara:strand:+ start:2626 stop:4122 length:1497 start_codon:yes stop_codon:yes gene_type:complete